jgi:hypothetical protein
MQRMARALLVVGVVAASLAGGAPRAEACNGVTERWLLDPNETRSYLGGISQLVLIAGARLPDDRKGLNEHPTGDTLDFWPRTQGIAWEEGNWVPDCPGCDPNPGFGWFFGTQFGSRLNLGGAHGPLLLKVLTVDKACFEGDRGNGSLYLHANQSLVQNVESNANSIYNPIPFAGCLDRESREPAGAGRTGAPASAMTLAAFNVPGWGFGEYFEIEQAGDLGQTSQVYTHDGHCEDDQPVTAVASSFEILGGAEPPFFHGPNGARTNFGNAGSYRSYTIAGNSGNSYENVTIMAKQSEAICYLVGLGGFFVYDAERAEIRTEYVNGEPYWALATRAYDKGSVAAAANCYAYDQRTFIPGPARPSPRPPNPTPRPR